jgi:hypothetical protein
MIPAMGSGRTVLYRFSSCYETLEDTYPKSKNV